MARTEVMHASEMSCSKLMILINDIYVQKHWADSSS